MELVLITLLIIMFSIYSGKQSRSNAAIQKAIEDQNTDYVIEILVKRIDDQERTIKDLENQCKNIKLATDSLNREITSIYYKQKKKKK
ncbi:MAG: hypothetical protein GY853_14375 [PVC group bacterium]|nr:hypothetical protein [PVC group bacterium]